MGRGMLSGDMKSVGKGSGEFRSKRRGLGVGVMGGGGLKSKKSH